jgi:hypothetical protein
MPIFSVGSASDLLGQTGGQGNWFSDDSADAEWLIYEFLIKHFRLTEQDARRTIVSVIDAGESLVDLAHGIENFDDAVIDLLERYQPSGGSSYVLNRDDNSLNDFSGDSADAEWLIYEFLIKHFKLTEQQARQVMLAVIEAGEDLVELAVGIQTSDQVVIYRLASYQNLGDSSDSVSQSHDNLQQFTDASADEPIEDPADAEWLIYQLLTQYFRLTERETRQAMVSLIDADENLLELAQRVKSGDYEVLGRIERYIPQ